MTIVTNIALICDPLESSDWKELVQPSPVSQVQNWLREHCDDQALTLIKGTGPYGHDFDFWSASFNRIGSAAEEFASYATSIDWNFPENVVLIVEPEEGDTRVFRPAFTPSDIWRT